MEIKINRVLFKDSVQGIISELTCQKYAKQKFYNIVVPPKKLKPTYNLPLFQVARIPIADNVTYIVADNYDCESDYNCQRFYSIARRLMQFSKERPNYYKRIQTDIIWFMCNIN